MCYYFYGMLAHTNRKKNVRSTSIESVNRELFISLVFLFSFYLFFSIELEVNKKPNKNVSGIFINYLTLTYELFDCIENAHAPYYYIRTLRIYMILNSIFVAAVQQPQLTE